MNSSSYDEPSQIDRCALPVIDAGRVREVLPKREGASTEPQRGWSGPTGARSARGDVIERMPPEVEVIDTADIFDLLSDPNRLRLLVAMVDGELCVCDLAAVTGMSESATSHALRLLRAHRVVTARRSGRRAFYRLADSHVRMLLDLAFTHTQHTDAMHPERG